MLAHCLVYAPLPPSGQSPINTGPPRKHMFGVGDAQGPSRHGETASRERSLIQAHSGAPIDYCPTSCPRVSLRVSLMYWCIGNKRYELNRLFVPQMYILTLWLWWKKAGKHGNTPMDIVDRPSQGPRTALLMQIKGMLRAAVVAAGN